MRVLFASLPAYGHLLPLMPLASAFRDAGHDVLIATGGSFASSLAERGWAVRDVPPRVEHAVRDLAATRPDLVRLPPAERWRMGLELFAEVLPERTVPLLGEVVGQVRPDLVVYEQEDLGAAVVSAAAGVPAVRHGLGPALPPVLLEAFADAVRRRAGDLGGTALPGGRAVLGVAQLGIYPEGLQDAGPAPSAHSAPSVREVTVRPVPWSWQAGRPATVPAPGPAPRTGRPLVHLTLGTAPAAAGGAGDLVEAARGLARLDVDVLATVGPDGDVDALPAHDRLRVERFVDQEVVLSRAAVVVHHGGSGTTLASFAHGRPQLVVHQGKIDQVLNGRAVVRAGAGAALAPEDVSAARVADEVRRLLEDPAPTAGAVAVARRIAAMPAPTEVVPTLAALALGGPGAGPGTHPDPGTS